MCTILFWLISVAVSVCGVPGNAEAQTSNISELISLVLQLRWLEIIIVAEDIVEIEAILEPRELSVRGIQHVLISGSDAVSGNWVSHMIRTGEDSWRPLNVIMVCSLPCVQAALDKASQREQLYGTQTAVGMSSPWLLIQNADLDLKNRLNVGNITMDNVAIADLGHKRERKFEDNVHTCSSKTPEIQIFTLLYSGGGRTWRKVRSGFDGLLKNGMRHTVGDHAGLGSSQFGVDRVIYPNSGRGFNGRNIRVIMKEWLFFLFPQVRNETKVWSGLNVDMLNFLSDALNFTYTLVDGTDDVWGSGTAADADTGVFGYIIRKEVDLGLAPAEWIPERAKVMDFTDPIDFSSVVMVYRRPQSRDHVSLLSPLNGPLLSALVGSLVFVSIFMFLLEVSDWFWKKEANAEGRFMSRRYKLACQRCLRQFDSVMQVTGSSLVSEPSEVRIRSTPGKVLLSSWWMFSILIGAIYSGTLTAVLSARRDGQLFTSLQDLVAKEHEYKWGTYGRSGVALTLQNSKQAVYQKVWVGIQSFYQTDKDVLSEDITRLVDKVRTENFVLLFYERLARVMFADDCRIVTVEAGMGQPLSSLVLPKGSALTGPVSLVIQRLHADGILSRWGDQWFPRTVCPPPPDTKVITLAHVQGFLVIAPAGVGLALLVLGAEILYCKRRLRKPASTS